MATEEAMLIIERTFRQFSELRDLVESKPGPYFFAALEYPTVGTSIRCPLIPLSGWVVLERNREREFWIGNGTLRVATVTNFIPRQDLNTLAIELGISDQYEILGFECVVPGFLFVEGHIYFRLVIEDPTELGNKISRNCLDVTVAQLDEPKDMEEEVLFPVFVTSLGRSGSTLLHALLSAHPNGIGETTYPRECKFAQAIMSDFLSLNLSGVEVRPNWGATLEYDAYFSKRLNLSILLQDKAKNYEYIFSKQWSKNVEFARELVHDTYVNIVGRPVEEGSRSFIVEKSSNVMSSILASYFYDRVSDITLIRDPRDLISSALRYHSQSTPGDFAEFTTDFEGAVAQLNRDLIALDGSISLKRDFSFVVRYDDLINNRSDVLGDLFRFIGFPLDPNEVGTVVARAEAELALVSDRHITSTSRGESAATARWTKDLSSQQISLCNDVFGWFIAKYFERGLT